MPEFAHNITLTAEGHVSRLRFQSDHPANVFTLPMLEELHERLKSLATPGDTRVLIVEGGERIFSGGADLASIREMDPATYRTYIETEYAAFRALEVLPIITIASINGACVGNAAEFALACDFRVATKRSKIGWPEIHVGFDAPAQRLARFIGIGKAKELVFGGELLGAAAALEIGLLTQVVEVEELASAVATLSETYSKRAPVAVRLTKENIESAYDFSTASSKTTAEIDAAAAAFATEDFREGSGAILERRDPAFAGR